MLTVYCPCTAYSVYQGLLIYTYEHETLHRNHPVDPHLQIINERTQPLRSAEPIFKEEPDPLHVTAISHPLSKARRIRMRLLQDLLRSRRRSNILPGAPASAALRALIAQQEVVQQLGALGVRCILQDGAGLWPGDEFAFGGEAELEAWGVAEGVRRGEGGCAAAVGGAKDGAGCLGAADPAGVVGEEGLEPFHAEVGVFEAVGRVSGCSWMCSFRATYRRSNW